MLAKKNEAYIYTYPRWYWTTGYFLSVPFGLFICLLIYDFVFRPGFTLGPFIFNMLLFSAVFYGILWATNRYKKLYADVIMSNEGITATVISRENGRIQQVIRTGIFTKWADVSFKEYFGPNDWDARSVGGMTAGYRVFVPGGKILIFGRLVWKQAGFEQAVALINERT